MNKSTPVSGFGFLEMVGRYKMQLIAVSLGHQWVNYGIF
jgi:hypothetical protein